ncbi:hypothetical protein GPECTOR_282g747 [Gonium pectorale]|uniref:Uncharacterized protein n=1 Tax=Gonium pectorale TaxID=33097 RepID=A0A150FW10_GONPE|nr:hypothetical protein GPECTOR_282g747 [Gonium pectorale]|eukprot:KXZ41789.1 hypothetical protein GPECTOR_282g747 [Gonium pectorale]
MDQQHYNGEPTAPAAAAQLSATLHVVASEQCDELPARLETQLEPQPLPLRDEPLKSEPSAPETEGARAAGPGTGASARGRRASRGRGAARSRRRGKPGDASASPGPKPRAPDPTHIALPVWRPGSAPSAAPCLPNGAAELSGCEAPSPPMHVRRHASLAGALAAWASGDVLLLLEGTHSLPPGAAGGFGVGADTGSDVGQAGHGAARQQGGHQPQPAVVARQVLPGDGVGEPSAPAHSRATAVTILGCDPNDPKKVTIRHSGLSIRDAGSLVFAGVTLQYVLPPPSPPPLAPAHLMAPGLRPAQLQTAEPPAEAAASRRVGVRVCSGHLVLRQCRLECGKEAPGGRPALDAGIWVGAGGGLDMQQVEVQGAAAVGLQLAPGAVAALAQCNVSTRGLARVCMDATAAATSGPIAAAAGAAGATGASVPAASAPTLILGKDCSLEAAGAGQQTGSASSGYAVLVVYPPNGYRPHIQHNACGSAGTAPAPAAAAAAATAAASLLFPGTRMLLHTGSITPRPACLAVAEMRLAARASGGSGGSSVSAGAGSLGCWGDGPLALSALQSLKLVPLPPLSPDSMAQVTGISTAEMPRLLSEIRRRMHIPLLRIVAQRPAAANTTAAVPPSMAPAAAAAAVAPDGFLQPTAAPVAARDAPRVGNDAVVQPQPQEQSDCQQPQPCQRQETVTMEASAQAVSLEAVPAAVRPDGVMAPRIGRLSRQGACPCGALCIGGCVASAAAATARSGLGSTSSAASQPGDVVGCGGLPAGSQRRRSTGTAAPPPAGSSPSSGSMVWGLGHIPGLALTPALVNATALRASNGLLNLSADGDKAARRLGDLSPAAFSPYGFRSLCKAAVCGPRVPAPALAPVPGLGAAAGAGLALPAQQPGITAAPQGSAPHPGVGGTGPSVAYTQALHQQRLLLSSYMEVDAGDEPQAAQAAAQTRKHMPQPSSEIPGKEAAAAMEMLGGERTLPPAAEASTLQPGLGNGSQRSPTQVPQRRLQQLSPVTEAAELDRPSERLLAELQVSPAWRGPRVAATAAEVAAAVATTQHAAAGPPQAPPAPGAPFVSPFAAAAAAAATAASAFFPDAQLRGSAVALGASPPPPPAQEASPTFNPIPSPTSSLNFGLLQGLRSSSTALSLGLNPGASGALDLSMALGGSLGLSSEGALIAGFVASNGEHKPLTAGLGEDLCSWMSIDLGGVAEKPPGDGGSGVTTAAGSMTPTAAALVPAAAAAAVPPGLQRGAGAAPAASPAPFPWAAAKVHANAGDSSSPLSSQLQQPQPFCASPSAAAAAPPPPPSEQLALARALAMQAAALSGGFASAADQAALRTLQGQLLAAQVAQVQMRSMLLPPWRGGKLLNHTSSCTVAAFGSQQPAPYWAPSPVCAGMPPPPAPHAAGRAAAMPLTELQGVRLGAASEMPPPPAARALVPVFTAGSGEADAMQLSFVMQSASQPLDAAPLPPLPHELPLLPGEESGVLSHGSVHQEAAAPPKVLRRVQQAERQEQGALRAARSDSAQWDEVRVGGGLEGLGPAGQAQQPGSRPRPLQPLSSAAPGVGAADLDAAADVHEIPRAQRKRKAADYNSDGDGAAADDGGLGSPGPADSIDWEPQAGLAAAPPPPPMGTGGAGGQDNAAFNQGLMMTWSAASGAMSAAAAAGGGGGANPTTAGFAAAPAPAALAATYAAAGAGREAAPEITQLAPAKARRGGAWARGPDAPQQPSATAGPQAQIQGVEERQQQEAGAPRQSSDWPSILHRLQMDMLQQRRQGAAEQQRQQQFARCSLPPAAPVRAPPGPAVGPPPAGGQEQK